MFTEHTLVKAALLKLFSFVIVCIYCVYALCANVGANIVCKHDLELLSVTHCLLEGFPAALVSSHSMIPVTTLGGEGGGSPIFWSVVTIC